MSLLLAQTAWDGLSARAIHPILVSCASRFSPQMIFLEATPGSAWWSIVATRVLWVSATNFLSRIKYLFAENGVRGTAAVKKTFLGFVSVRYFAAEQYNMVSTKLCIFQLCFHACFSFVVRFVLSTSVCSEYNLYCCTVPMVFFLYSYSLVRLRRGRKRRTLTLWILYALTTCRHMGLCNRTSTVRLVIQFSVLIRSAERVLWC